MFSINLSPIGHDHHRFLCSLLSSPPLSSRKKRKRKLSILLLHFSTTQQSPVIEVFPFSPCSFIYLLIIFVIVDFPFSSYNITFSVRFCSFFGLDQWVSVSYFRVHFYKNCFNYFLKTENSFSFFLFLMRKKKFNNRFQSKELSHYLMMLHNNWHMGLCLRAGLFLIVVTFWCSLTISVAIKIVYLYCIVINRFVTVYQKFEGRRRKMICCGVTKSISSWDFFV